jgi:hypothetical protein
MLGFFREKQAFKVDRRGVLALVPADRLNFQAMVPVVAMLDPRSAFNLIRHYGWSWLTGASVSICA